MNFPTFEKTLLALLTVTRDVTKQNSDSYNTERAIRNLAKHFNLTTDEKELELSGGGKIFRELVTSARDHLRGAKLIEGSNRDFETTTAGRSLLRKKPVVIDEKILLEYAGYKAFLKEMLEITKLNAKWHKENKILTSQETLILLKKTISEYNNKSKTVNNASKISIKPVQLNLRYSLEEQIVQLHNEHNEKLKADLLAKVKAMHPAMFEELSVSVLSKLIYPEARSFTNLKDFGKTLGRSGDGGIDGVITKKDAIRGETKYFVQCKRWKTNTIGEPQIRDFVGALVKQKAKVGIFITTTSFTKAAEEYVLDLEKFEVKLIDGDEFVHHMIEHEVGVQRLSSYRLKAIDQEFFSSKSVEKTTLF